MSRECLQLEDYNGIIRGVFKTNHGRTVYIRILERHGIMRIKECCYIDRVGRQAPKSLVSKRFKSSELLTVIAHELDKQFYGIDMLISPEWRSDNLIIQEQLEDLNKKPNPLIFVGEGELYKGMHKRLKTRFMNCNGRIIYLELECDADKKIYRMKKCCYCDRNDRRTPEGYLDVALLLSHNSILQCVNLQFNAGFTDIIIADGRIYDIDSTPLPLC